MLVTFRGEFRKVFDKDYDYEGYKGTNHLATLEVEDGSFNFKLNDEMSAYFKNGHVVKGNEYLFRASFDPRWKKLTIVGVQELDLED